MTQTVTNWKVFKETLSQHPNLELRFKYGEGKVVDAAYHITEIKQASITSVDCGGELNKWTEIIVQLWVPENEQQEHSMEVSKALSIVKMVEKLLPLDDDGIVKIEFGNSEFDTCQMFPNEILIDGTSLIIDMRPDAVQCKALARGGSCGTNDKNEECCSPTTEKRKIQLINLVVPAEACYTRDSGCC